MVLLYCLIMEWSVCAWEGWVMKPASVWQKYKISAGLLRVIQEAQAEQAGTYIGQQQYRKILKAKDHYSDRSKGSVWVKAEVNHYFILPRKSYG